MVRARALSLGALLTAVAALAGCGGDSKDESDATSTPGQTTIPAVTVPTTTTPTTTTPATPSLHMSRAKAKGVVAPIVARLRRAGYSVTVRKGVFVGWSELGSPYFNGTFTVYRTNAIARELTAQGATKDTEYAVIGTRGWTASQLANSDITNLEERFRQLVGTAEGCGSGCDFSASSFGSG